MSVAWSKCIADAAGWFRSGPQDGKKERGSFFSGDDLHISEPGRPGGLVV